MAMERGLRSHRRTGRRTDRVAVLRCHVARGSWSRMGLAMLRESVHHTSFDVGQLQLPSRAVSPSSDSQSSCLYTTAGSPAGRWRRQPDRRASDGCRRQVRGGLPPAPRSCSVTVPSSGRRVSDFPRCAWTMPTSGYHPVLVLPEQNLLRLHARSLRMRASRAGDDGRRFIQTVKRIRRLGRA